jgi:hypothetical protein
MQEIVIKSKDSAVKIGEGEIDLKGNDIPEGKYILREEVKIIAINEAPQP